MKMTRVAMTALCLLSPQFLAAATVTGAVPTGWTYQGNAGSGTADGVVSASPVMGGGYSYVSTNNGLNGVGALDGVGGSGSPTDGSVLTTSVFSAAAGDALEFYFNYVTSDGSGYADYSWARLLDGAGAQVALLFTARTNPGGNTVPGFSMPEPEAVLSPGLVTITPGGPEWSALGGSSGSCYATGCGFTGWIKSSFSIAAAGDYALQFGVTNWNDEAYASGMAIAGATIGGTPIDPNEPGPAPVPLPAAGWLMIAGLGGLAALRRKRR